MTNERRKAAERCRRELIDSWSDTAVKGPTYTQLLAVLDAYLAEHPADDDDPLTAEWLTTAGGQVGEDGRWWFYGGGRDVALTYHDNRECGDVYRLATCGGLPRAEVSTRGQLRRLCDSLGMKLKESK